MGIAVAYVKYVDEGLVVDQSVVDEWVASGAQEVVEARVAGLVERWCLMNVYLAGGFERAETAKVARQVARGSASWLMKIAEIEAYDWTYVNTSSLMPSKGSKAYKTLAHTAASLDIVDWLGRWREDSLAQLTWFCSVSALALQTSAGRPASVRKRLNRLIHAFDRELEGVLHAIRQDQAKPRRRKKEDAEED